MVTDPLKCIEKLLDAASEGLSTADLANQVGEEEASVWDLLWRTGRSQLIAYDGFVWMRASAGPCVAPIIANRLF